ncbi:acetyl-CoA synthetase-like protein [Delitschia confertaspora ATCC 74209]|uniref:Acetyl-CoA synthetase-like protein n=1 Tax=Delitschia confertaspora ATCC 74209 TaxID=1513339 RepID=A0A9P4JKP4_9PLEO|nr:acetyl-CoA synthetase-like protein [Delitschia confertaspora ATCC 74209]
MPASEQTVSDQEPATEAQRALRSIWAHVLNLPEEQVSLERSFLSLGGDSISAMQVMGQCRKQGMALSVQEILRAKSILDLASAVKELHVDSASYDEEIDKPFGLTPIQSLWWQLPNQGHGHFNQSFYLLIKKRTTAEEFRFAVEKLVSRHSMLRARFSFSQEAGWQQRVTEDVVNSYRFRHRQPSSLEQINEDIADCQTCLDPQNGPLFAADLFEYNGEQRAFLVGQHLVIDLVSWRLLLEELEEMLSGGSLLPPALPFQKWSQMQLEHAKTLDISKVVPHVDVPAIDFGYWGISHQDNTYGNAGHDAFELDSDITARFMNDCHNALRTEPLEVLLASLIHSWNQVFTDRALPAIMNEGHGREPWDSSIDVSRTVGWFTTLYPIFVQPGEDLVTTVRRVKDFRRQIPANGREYFAKRVLTSEGQEAFKTHWPMEISFNYLGQYQQLERADALLQPIDSMAGETREAGGTSDVGHKAPRFGLFEISAIIFKGRLKFAFTFNRHMLHQDRIRQWVSACQQTLVEMTQKLITATPEATMSDFPLLSLTEDRFQSMLQRLSNLGVSSAEIEDAYPCSDMQEGLLLSMNKDSGFYAAVNIHEVKVPHGKPDAHKLANAWRKVVQRHAALRTIFLENLGADEGLYDQVVLNHAEANISILECKNEQDALKVFDEQRSVSYDTGRNTPHRFTICHTADGRIFSCLEISHAIMDGHSMSLLYRDLHQAYEGSMREEGPLYSNYISYLKSLPGDASLDFWKSYLSGSEVCSFPILNDGLTVKNKELRSIRPDFGNLSIQDLQAFCSSHSITLSNVFHTAWAITLSCYIGSKDVTFGYLTSARDVEGIPGVENIVGPMINTLVCRVKLSNGTLLDVLAEVQQDYMNSIPHRHTSLAEVQHSLELGGANLFNTALSYRKLPPQSSADESGLQFVEVAPAYDPTEYPVSLNIEVSEESAIVDLDYWTDHLSDGQAGHVASAFIRALENIVFHADQSLATLDHVGGKQLQQILEWNVMPETLNDCVHRRFEQWAKEQPDAPAIRGFDGDYTYAELDRVAERLAHYLVELGVGPEVFVPTCFDKSSFTVIAMLAVLKAGGAAVPLDAKHPKSALEIRIEESKAQVVLTSVARSEMFEDIVPDVVIVDSVLLDDLEEHDSPACPEVGPGNPAFVIFTSGSTGRPKGVVLEHAAMVTSANAHGTNLGIGPGSRFLQFASYTFDNSLEEMFTSLQRGGCVCVPSEDQRMNDLANAIAELGANFMDLTPTVAALLNPADVPGIKGMALGGEALTKAVVEQWYPHVHLHGQYGPSEASINSAWKDFKNGGEPTNIGYAIGSVSWIVDPENRNRLVPIGCKGELLIEGPILSRGYLNEPEKTAQAFIMDPEWARAGGVTGRRFYCTGDLVHYTSKGEMMYLGRKDSQVKLNGQRIELGEIEHHLKLNLPAEAQSAVELIAVNAGGKPSKALAAFLCLVVDESVGTVAEGKPRIAEMTDAVRETAKGVEVALSNALPAYYVPTMWIPVTTMPMTTSGKLDRKVLRALAQAIKDEELQTYRLAGKSGRAPSGHVEITLAKLWETVLRLAPDSVGVDDSFFRLGGDSIGAMRLVTAARKEGIILTVANIFSRPKLLEMVESATVLSSEAMTETETDTAPFELLPADCKREILDFAASECGVFHDSIEDIYPCTQLQEGLIALSTKEPGAYVAETIYRLPADVDLARFRKAWDQVIAIEPILRTRVIYTEKKGFVQVVVKDAAEWHYISDLQDIKETDRHLPATPGGPLTRYTIVGEGTRSPYFVWTAHHAVYDGWSLPSLLAKVEDCYKQTSGPVTSVPYSRFINYLSSIDQKQSDDFWINAFADITAPQFPQLPSPGYQVQASSQLIHEAKISRQRGMEITMPSMIRAAWALLLATYSGSDDVLWGETNSGRDVPVPGVEDILGPTITTAPVRFRLDRQTTLQEYLQDVQKQSSLSLPYQFAGLQHIKKLSSDTAVACEFQSLLVIAAGDSMKDPEGGLWDLQSTGTIGTNFFNYPLILNCTVANEGVELEAHYDAKVISTWLVEHMLHEFEYILTRFNSSETMKTSLADFILLNPADEQLLSSWNSHPAPKITKTIHAAIQEQVILRPQAIALDAWDTKAMTYQELDDRATRLASTLIGLGVKPNDFVPLCFDKSGWTIIAMLAVMKAGAAFVPLDFESPILRLREICGDVDARLILCSPKFKELVRSIPCEAVTVDRQSTDIQAGQMHKLPSVQSDMPAYVIFTSGSTGKPKGALLCHEHFVSSSAAFAPAMRIGSESRVLQFASYTFDACLIEILSVLIEGGCICVPDQASRTNDLVGIINNMNIDWVCLTPSVVRTIQPSQVPQVKTLVLVGEAMSQQDLITWADRVTLVNGYGPTECSAIATVNIMTPTTSPSNLGRVVTARGWVVNKDNHHVLTPMGAIGELILEGGGVGAGYLKNPEKTAAAYINNVKWTHNQPSKDEGATRRFYKTGDLVKYLEDGTLLYLGRKDSQTKVRGQRLELSEVEHHLVEDPLVQNVLAAVPTSGPCAKRLVGVLSLQELAKSKATDSHEPLHILPTDVASFNIASIRDRVCERLPSYMVPSLWIAVNSFPLMPSGKMDRRRVVQWLEKMDSETYRTISTIGLEAPKEEVNDVESKLQAIFGKVLNLPAEDIRLNQSFLHLGGDSIAAMQVSSQCRAAGFAITVQEIIRAKSIAQLASKVQVSQDDGGKEKQKEYNLPFELAPVQRVFFQSAGECYNHFNQSVVLKLAKSFEVKEIEDALTALVNIHPLLKGRYFRDETRVWKQRIEKETKGGFRLRQHNVESGKDRFMRPIIEESQATLDITRGPTFSVDLFDMEDTYSQAIALVAHHLVIDVVSWGIVLEDLQNLLNGVTPPPQSLPFHSWIQAQAEQAKQDSASKVFPVQNVPVADLEYWGMSSKPNIHGDVITEDIELSPKDSMLLLGAQDALNTEPLDIFVAALLESFRKTFPDRNTVAIHNEGHGREPFDTKQDLSRTIGWFTTLLPIHLPVPADEPTDIISTIRWVKDLRERVPDKGRPYFAYRLLTEEGKERFAGHWPAEVTFNYLGRMQNLERKDALLQKMDGITSSDVGDEVPRWSLFEVSAVVSQGTIKMSFTFNRHMQRQREIRQWIKETRQTLVDAVEQILSVRPERTLSDFKLLPLSYNGMAKLNKVLPQDMTIEDIEDIYPASPMQQGILLSQLKHPEFYAYHCIFEIQSTDLNKPVNPRKIAEAWQIVVHRHPALRTVFIESLSKTGLMDQIVFREKAGRISWITDASDTETPANLRNLPPVDYRDFNPPHRFTICKTTSNRVWVKLEMSHAVVDGSSVTNILGDLARAYEGKLSRAESGPLYSDFVAHLLSTSRDADVNYWKAYLAGAEPCHFPTLTDGKSQPHEVADYTIHLENSAQLQGFCKREGVTMSNVIQLAWALLLHVYVGASDVSFGVVASGRDVPVHRIEEAAGCFVNMLVCRVNLEDNTSIQQVLQQLQTDSVNAMSHQSCSLADVQHELQLASLFNTVFTFQRRQLDRDPEKTALLYENVEAADPGEYHITVNADVSEDGTTVDFGFWKDKVCPAQARNMVETFERILTNIVESQDRELTVGGLDLVTAGSLQQIAQWNKDLFPAVNRTLHEVFQEQALLRPKSAKAIEGWDGNFTYQELDEVTTRLAIYLQSIGVTTETFVPILFGKSSYAIVAMIAIMKAGGGYVPLDPKHPKTRLQQLIADVGAKVVLCSRNYHERAAEVADTAVVVDRKAVEKLSIPRGAQLKSNATPDNIAYCLFTSGTTGTPKGTLISHRAICTSTYAFSRLMHISATSRTFQFASYTFDASCAEIHAALTVGACICVPTEEDRMSDPAGAIRKYNATWTFMTPSVLSTMKPERVPSLKTLVVGGEAVPPAVTEKWRKHTNFINGYGPTETTIFAVCGEKSTLAGEMLESDAGTIGWPSGCRLWVVHPRNHDRLMPVGAVGELLIEGYTAARGYLNDPVKTTKSFIKNPDWRSLLSSEDMEFQTERMYKTGDLVRYNSDGSIFCIGRKDTQIKLNGQRIELGEIEYHVKSKFPEGVQSAVELVAPASRNGTKALAVFFSMDEGDGKIDGAVQPVSNDLPASDELLRPMQDHLRDMCKSMENAVGGVLPSYMIPSIFFPLKKMPFTSAGKLDRHRLKNLVANLSKEAVQPYRLNQAGNKKKPMTVAEKKLIKLVAGVLGVQESVVGSDDSFIRLGGDSVAAMRLVSAAQAEKLDLSVIDIFKTPKLSDLAAKCAPTSAKLEENLKPFQLIKRPLSAAQVIDEVAQQCRVPKDKIHDAYPASPLQEAFVTLSIKQAGAYVAQHILELDGNVDLKKFMAAWQKTVQEIDLLRTRLVQTMAGTWLQVVLVEDPIDFQQLQTLEEAEKEAATVPAHNGGVLTKYAIVRTNRNKTYFVWTLHHALYDGWSLPFMFQRVEQIYKNGGSELSKTPYSKFIKYLMDTNTEASMSYWSKTLSGASPYQFPQRSVSTAEKPQNGKVLSHTAKLAPRGNSDITQSALIRAAWALLLGAYTNSADVVFGETLTGRDIALPGVTDIVGPTLTTVPTRVQINRDLKVQDFLKVVADISADRIPHQHTGLAEIKRINSDTAAACEFQNLLAIQTGSAVPEEGLWRLYNNGTQSNYFTYPLVLECHTGASDLEITAYYDENVIEGWQIQRLLFQMDAVLQQLSSASIDKLHEVQVFSKQDVKLVREWNTNEPVVVDKTIHGLFLEQAELRPDAEAVAAFDGEFSYKELKEHANKLALQLIELGVGPEKVVPLCMDKSRWAIVAIMGILLAGGAYVPLSPEHPISRHCQIIQDCKAEVLLCSPSYESRFESVVSEVVLVSESEMRRKSLSGRVGEVPLRAEPGNVCYVLYTSGSTGTPKGVVIEHRAIASSSAAMRKALYMDHTSRVFQFANLVFDASVMEILTALTAGATICIPSDEERTADITGAINKLQATWTCLTPSVANVMDGPHAVPSLKTLAAGAEAMTEQTIEKWGKGLHLLNAYGPTEASIVAISNDKVYQQRDSSNIGNVLQSSRAWVVNPEDPHQLSPIGAVGELCIEGPLLARGYLNNPTKTAEAFVDNPTFVEMFGPNGARKRIYRTGDLVQYASDGSIKYVGRKDNQVKLAGQRMELGEIEHQLQADPRVRQAVVVMPKVGPAKRGLVAVVSLKEVDFASVKDVPWTEPLEDKNALKKMGKARSRLSDLLPSYMVPATWIAVKAIPALASAKLDRKQVVAWIERMDEGTYRRVLDLESSSEPAVPATEMGKRLQEIWAKVLNLPVERVGLNKGWMALGGDSITAMQLLARCRKEGINLSLNQVLRSKSIAHLADSIGSSNGVFDNGVEKVDTPFELSPIQKMYFEWVGEDRKAHFNQSFTLELTKKIDVQRLKMALDKIVEAHSMLRARFALRERGEWKQVILGNAKDAYVFQERNVTTKEIPDAVAQTQKSLDIVSGPVFAADLLQVGPKQILFLAAHHLVVDMVSWRVILGDLEEMLRSGKFDIQVPLSFQVWSERQAENAKQQTAGESGKRNQFAVATADLDFWGMDGQENVYGDVERDSFVVDEKVSRMALDEHCALRTEAVDLFLAAIIHSFSRVFISRNTPTVFNETHGREPWENSNLDLSRTVGWFTTMYPITVPIGEEEDDVVQTVRKIKDSRRRVQDNGRPYFAHRFLTEEGKRDYANHMPMELLFNYLGKMQQLESSDALFKSVEFTEDEEAKMTDLGSKTARPALFEISASVARGKVQFTFMYNRWMRNQKGIRRWIAECQRTLTEIVGALAKIKSPQPTLTDFPLLPLDSYDRLARVVKTLPGAGIRSFEDVEDMYPCAAMQEGMILSQIKEPESYLSHSILEVKSKGGRVDVRRLERAWQRVVERHPALRTVFVDSVCKGGVFDQVVVKNVDSGVLSSTCADTELLSTLKSMKYKDLNGRKKPKLPHQFTIMQTDSGRVVVKLEINHAVIDGGSYPVILKDLENAYEGRLGEEEGPLYSDYIKYLRSQPAGTAVNYWKQHLKGLRPCYFPATPQVASKQRQLQSLWMDFDQFGDLQKLSERNSVTFSNIMLAVWAMVLRTYTGSSDVCYGYLTSGRNVPVEGIQSAVGAFINMLVARVGVIGSSSVMEVCRKVQEDFIESLPHQHCSLAQFQHDLGLKDKSLFNTAVSIQNHGAGLSEDKTEEMGEGLVFEDLDAVDPSEFAITVNIEAARNDEGVRFAYWTDIVSDDMAKNVSSTMAKILKEILRDPACTVKELDEAVAEKSVSKPLVKHTRMPTLNIPVPDLDEMRRRLSRDRTPSISSRTGTPGLSGLAPMVTAGLNGNGTPDWGSLIRSIVNEVVPQIVERVLEKNISKVPGAPQGLVSEAASHTLATLHRRASNSLRARPDFRSAVNIETGSIKSRRMSTASDAESRINLAADMVAAAGVMATEAFKSVPPDFVEKKLLGLWSDLLDTVEDSIGKEDSFFQLGGDSIIAMRLVGAAREEGLSMTVADVFKNPTFADMARVVRVAGEVIDQVMSQHGGDAQSVKEAFASSSKSKQSPAKAWKDFQSMISENAISDAGSEGVSPKNEIKKDQMFNKWNEFSTQAQNQIKEEREKERSLAIQTHREKQRESPRETQRPVHSQTIHEGHAAHKSISLMGDPNVDSVISKVQVFKGGISDVLPVTDFQALAITGTLLESKWMLNYFYLDGAGPLDLRKMKQTAFRLVQAFDILRTVFVPYGDRFLQVVLRKLTPDFIYQETELDLDAFTDELRQRDREHGPRLGETFTKFIVAKQKKTEHYRIFMRLSHAQYDGFCLPRILGALEAGYNGLPISSAPSFGNYVRESHKTVEGAHDHWREVLRGSKMTEIVHRYGPNYQRSAGRTVTLKQTLTVPLLNKVNITTATIMKAAWASTLARLAGQRDIVFGHVISGRNGTVPNVENIIGPCLNMVPVRVVFQRDDWTVLDLLKYIQDQQIANMPYESLGFREITRNCTDWPDWTNFSSVLQHNQNIHSDGAALRLAGVEYKVGAVGSQEDFADFSIVSSSQGGDQVEVVLTYAPNSTITPEYAQNVFDMLCATAITFAEDPYTLLPSRSEIRNPESFFSYSHALDRKSSSEKSKGKQKAKVMLPTVAGLSKEDILALSNTLRFAWEAILRSSETGHPVDTELSSNFFELGGDIMGLAQVSSILENEGFRVRVEDLIERCVFVEQVQLLCEEKLRQIKEEEENPWGAKGMKRNGSKGGEKTESVDEKGGEKGGFGKLVKRFTFGSKGKDRGDKGDKGKKE